MANYHIYETYTGKGVEIHGYTNKEAAIQDAKNFALENKQSMNVVREKDDQVIAICEFPYYLRNLELTTKDIYVNRIDRF